MKKILSTTLFILLLLTTFLSKANAITITEDSLSSNINKFNTTVDTFNPDYLTEILDENGNVPSYEYYPKHIASRSIKALKAYDGKIFMGLGDWNDNTGPVKIIYYDTTDGKIKTSGTINDEAVQIFNIIDDKLYTTGCDPRDAWGYGSYYIYNKETNTWDQHKKNNGWIHVFNIVEFKNKLYMCGSTVDTTKTSTIQSSADNGETFENIPVYKNDTLLPYDSSLRCYNLVVLNNKLYGYIYYSSYNGIYEYDEVNNRFDYISNLPSSMSVASSVNNYNKIYLEHDIFNNQFIYVSGSKLYSSTDLKTFKSIFSATNETIRDVAVCNDTLYALAYKVNSDKTYTAKIYRSKDLSDFNLIYEFVTETPAFSIEYYENNIYIGTGYPSTVSSEGTIKNGSLYKISLNNAKKSINMNTTNKILEISDNTDTYSVEYDLSSGNSIFKTTLNFNNTMTEEQFKKEYSKIQELSYTFSSVAYSENVDFYRSIYYYNNVLSKNITTNSKDYTTAVEYANNIFSKELNITDSLFTLTTEKVSNNENEYITQVTLTINKDADFSSIKTSSSNNNSSGRYYKR